MNEYLLSIYQPDGEPPSPELLEPVMRNMHALTEDMKRSGAWVFAGGLHPPSTATVVRVQHGDALLTDGPYAEGKEHVGGFVIVRAPDLDGALQWARRLAGIVTLPGAEHGLAIEVRPFQHAGTAS